jgi:leader peptidase (prepilin peptidase) / N-methyltransferase
MTHLRVGDDPHLAEETQQRSKRRFWPADHRLRIQAWGAAAVCAFTASVFVAPGLPGLLGGGLGVTMVAIAAIDARQFVIPDKLVLVGLALGLVEIFFARAGGTFENVGSSALRALVLAALFLGFRLMYRWIRGRDGLGLGDVKLAAVAGLWLDWLSTAIAIEIASLSALAFVLIGVTRGKKVSNQTMVPFGLFFAPAIWLAWLFGEIIMR